MIDEIKNALILGKGVSGYAAKKLLKSYKIKNIIIDQNDYNFNSLKLLCEKQKFSHCVVSPGFANDHPWICFVKSLKISILTEFELGWSQLSGKTIAITGSNGKSTALKILYDTFLSAGIKVAIGGNYGTPVSNLAINNKDHDWYLLEVSSFQLENITSFKPDIAILLNVYPNHLDRHKTLESYFRIKCKIFKNTSNAKCINIIPYNLRTKIKNSVPKRSNWITFGNEEKADFRFNDKLIFNKHISSFSIKNTYLDKFNLCDSTAPALLSVIDFCKIDLNYFTKSIKSFNGLEHRIESLGTIDNIEFINDSKSTNMYAIINAIKNLNAKKSIKLIAGGVLKEKNITFVKEILADFNVTLYAYGISASFLCKSWNDLIPCFHYDDLKEASSSAYNDARSGDIVLLSPGCSSYDQFTSYIERGNYFKKIVNDFRLIKKRKKNEK